ncbi:MAG: peptidoglycan editing factor PgeF [Tatlockia sp.]|nr:peptidoglycan editing factor PgeF [Tatlockia sp.]
MPNLYANWPAPPNVFALTTKRNLGLSKAPYEANNLGLHVGDNKELVNLNRKALKENLDRPRDAEWLTQTHSTLCVVVEEESNRVADAAITRCPNRTLAIMTADCLPITLTNRQGTEIAAIHAGWRGLVNGIIENTLAKMLSPPEQLIAWIGPAICQSCFEVGEDVLENFQGRYAFTTNAFKSKNEKWLANLPQIAELVLKSHNVLTVLQSNICTYERKDDYYSYRRNAQTGRMATLIWFNENNRDK